MILGYEANIGLIYYGPKWSWAEMVMGRNGHGPKWLWAEMTRNPKIHLHPSGPFKSIKTMLRYLHVFLGLSPVRNRYQKGSQKIGTTVLSIIAYDEFKDRICKD